MLLIGMLFGLTDLPKVDGASFKQEAFIFAALTEAQSASAQKVFIY